MATNAPEPAPRKSSSAASLARVSAAEDVTTSLNDAVSRAEQVLGRLASAVSDAEERLDEARRDAERSIAAADELRQDVSSLIVALQGLAAEVDAQVREHTVALMRMMSAAATSADANASQRASASVAEEVSTLIEQLRATAEDISADLEAKSAELRELILQASRVRPAAPSRRIAPEAPVTPAPLGTRTPPADDEPPLPSVRERARVVQDQIELTRRPRSQDYGRYAEAVDLAASGVSADEIARRCGLGREEVRMLLRLRQSESTRR